MNQFFQALILYACLALTSSVLVGCSLFDSVANLSEPTEPSNSDLRFSKVDDGIYEIHFQDPLLLESPLFAIRLKECNNQTKKSLLGKARQLFIGLENLDIQQRRELASDKSLVSLSALASYESKRFAIVAYTWDQSGCLHDFLVWSKDATLAIPNSESENIAIAILDQYVLSSIKSNSI